MAFSGGRFPGEWGHCAGNPGSATRATGDNGHMSDWPSIAIVGAGMGGLATAAALHRRGIGVTVYEQERSFTRLGAGIQVGCNAMQVLRGLGLERRIRGEAFYPRPWNNRDW